MMGCISDDKDINLLGDKSTIWWTISKKDVLQILSTKVIQMVKAGEAGWEEMVPDTVADIIKEKCLFDYPCEVPALK